MRPSHAFVAAFLVALVQSGAIAQPAPPPPIEESGLPASYPASVGLFPAEVGMLRTRADLQFFYTNTDFGLTSVNVAFLGLDLQASLLDQFQIGLNIPFLVHASASGFAGGSSTEFGNITAKLKGKVYGSSTGVGALSIFANTTLPTGSVLEDRSFVFLHSGLAATVRPMPFLHVGADTGVIWFLREGQDVGIYILDFFFAGALHRAVNLQVAFQLGIPVHTAPGSSSDPGFSILPALQVFLTPVVHLDLGARIAVNDAGRLYAAGGRAALVFGIGFIR